MQKTSLYRTFFKRFFDILLSGTALLILSPIFLIVMLLVKINLGSPVIFKQKRPGKDSMVFNMYKFRTMTSYKDQNGNLLPDNLRLTSFGKLLRSTSLDELPELWNIFIGDMSIVGPRPLLEKYLSLYSVEQNRRHEVRPGLTGYAQANGRNSLSWQEKFKMDVHYVDHITFIGDIKIIWKTIVTVLKRDGISSETNETMEEFKGNE
ncbi:sugar transferase [Streptococcus parauberis]|uniref:UDP-galactose phosphate transferase n=1 Tax=Streptococcus parauberis TaxID=1348 RepID=A0A0E2UC83_9STRE|nr:sugar transferase [Streptococcus parauberis]AEF25348.1 surface-anchored sugar transferase [Streptococcus parauberis KCTC 11537]UWM91929.1 sugar transferase [Streptococcus parauberis]WEM63880.1 sugar transferase [Streptococcus parauberis]BAU04017.1 UDP-galactose phosphate transferase [Streptococcus parauberis]BAU04035.1 UDP-galactose phosphate transferase [Streptococcus parauberis]